MTEVNFFQSWAFWFLAGIVVGFIAGFVLAIILAASGRASRMEEEIEDNLFSYQTYNKTPIKENVGDEFYHRIAKFKNNWKPEIEIATQGKPEDG